jgi:hypothetical protein
MKEYTSGTRLIEKNNTVLGLYGDRSPGVKNVTPVTHEEYVEPFTQVAGYHCLGNGCVDLRNYEAVYSYFPVNWKDERPGVIHYIVTRKLEKNQPMEYNLHQDYEFIHATENLKLYRNRVEGFETRRSGRDE